MLLIPPLALTLSGVLSACAETETGSDGAGELSDAAFAPDYLGSEARMLDDTMLQVEVSMRGARNKGDVDRYAQCAAVSHALHEEFGFVRHLRTLVTEEAGLWRADGVYLISAALPPGMKTIDVEVVAADCAENGIPMV